MPGTTNRKGYNARVLALGGAGAPFRKRAATVSAFRSMVAMMVDGQSEEADMDRAARIEKADALEEEAVEWMARARGLPDGFISLEDRQIVRCVVQAACQRMVCFLEDLNEKKQTERGSGMGAG